MLLTAGNQKQKVSSLLEASQVYCGWRDGGVDRKNLTIETLMSLRGASEMPEGRVTDDDGKFLAKISYNGRIWAKDEWTPGDQAMIVPGNEESEAAYRQLQEENKKIRSKRAAHS